MGKRNEEGNGEKGHSLWNDHTESRNESNKIDSNTVVERHRLHLANL